MYGLECNVASTHMMTRIKQAYQEDPACAQVMAYCGTWLAAYHVRESRKAGILSSPRLIERRARTYTTGITNSDF